MNTSQSPSEHDMTPPTVFDEANLVDEGNKIKQNAILSIIATRGVNMLEETFNSLVVEAFMLNNYVVRAQMLQTVVADLDKGTLTRQNLDTAIKYLTSRVDSSAALLGRMVELVDECKTPGPRH